MTKKIIAMLARAFQSSPIYSGAGQARCLDNALTGNVNVKAILTSFILASFKGFYKFLKVFL